MKAIISRQRVLMGACLAATLLGGCVVTPVPSPIQRLPEGEVSKYAPLLSSEEKQKLTKLDAQILKEQENTIRAERAWSAYNTAYQNYWSNASFYGAWGGWGGPYYGVGIGGSWPYYPDSPYYGW